MVVKITDFKRFINTFQTEAPLLLTPYLKNLTDSEIHSVMTSGFATVSGKVFFSFLILEVLLCTFKKYWTNL